MEFSALVESQISADRRRGFEVDFESEAARVAQLEKDLVGLIGEVGEFANVLKKVSLGVTHAGYKGPSIDDAAPGVSAGVDPRLFAAVLVENPPILVKRPSICQKSDDVWPTSTSRWVHIAVKVLSSGQAGRSR